MYLFSFQNTLFIIFIVVLTITFIVFVFLIFYVLRLIRISTKLKAKQFEKFNQQAKPNQIVFLGDSLTEFYQIEEFFQDYLIYNRGIASDTTTGVLERLANNVIKIQPNKVFLQIGTNDYMKKKNPEILKNIIQILETLKDNLEDVKLYLISLYPVNPRAKFYSRFFTGPRKNKTIQALNNKLKHYCLENKIQYIDLYNELIDRDGYLDPKYTIEGLHISYEGYALITKILLPFVIE